MKEENRETIRIKLNAIIKLIVIGIIILVAGIIIISINAPQGEIVSVKSEGELYELYNEKYSDGMPIWLKGLTMPFSILGEISRGNRVMPSDFGMSYNDAKGITPDVTTDIESSHVPTTSEISSTTGSQESSYSKDYSTTNIQVENVDEADITKTDGNYIYSISDNNVIITDVRDPQNVKIAKKFNADEEATPVDLILNGNLLAVISEKDNNTYNSYDNETCVSIYNIDNKENPLLQKSFTLESSYYTSRCTNNKLYIISSGYLKKKKDEKKIRREYTEDGQSKTLSLENIKRIKDVETSKETTIAVVDMNNPKRDVKISKYLIDVSNAYVSENNIYLADYKREYKADSGLKVSALFGLKGVFGLFDQKNYNYNYSYKKQTNIYKFAINDGDLKYVSKATVDGATVNQYSMDEKNGHLRIATYNEDGTSITIFDDNMNKLGETAKMGKGEKMYSSRFIGNKAYLITYKTIDPLFVVDLSNEKNPQVLGELKISGYSAYLHPYDENHLIGIGMETETKTNKDLNGRVTSTSTVVVGMKMALFDVSNVNNPVTLSTTVIGDRRTTSAILSNPKALLFSKERELIAIPVNNYSEDFETNNSDSLNMVIENYKNIYSKRIGEGYAVYKINLKDGFKLKGMITHEKQKKTDYYSYYRYDSQMLRGMYIKDNLFTVSEDEIKVNNLENLEEIGKIRIRPLNSTSTRNNKYMLLD